MITLSKAVLALIILGSVAVGASLLLGYCWISLKMIQKQSKDEPKKSDIGEGTNADDSIKWIRSKIGNFDDRMIAIEDNQQEILELLYSYEGTIDKIYRKVCCDDEGSDDDECVYVADASGVRAKVSHNQFEKDTPCMNEMPDYRDFESIHPTTIASEKVFDGYNYEPSERKPNMGFVDRAVDNILLSEHGSDL